MSKRVFNPFGPSLTREGQLNVGLFRCPCGGVMFDVTTALVEATGCKHYECDKCHQKRGMRAPSAQKEAIAQKEARR